MVQIDTPRKGLPYSPVGTARRDEIVEAISLLNRRGRFSSKEVLPL